jgi:hypothetical protein
MTTPKINISSLDFDGIKTSLKEYLKNLPQYTDYNFEASGINMLLEVLSYNTLYYSYYANMIANETYLDTAQLENNIVSLVKPLGYLVSGKTCSKVEMAAKSVASTYTLTPYTSYFSGSSSSGTSYKFYPISSLTLNSGTDTSFTVYEAKTVVNNLLLSVDTTEQKAFLGTTDIDLNTLTVTVNGVTWTKYDNYEVDSGPDSLVYFLDRTSNGFYIIFGKRTLTDYQATYGKTIEPNDVVTVSYLIPSGTGANGISNITNSNITVSSMSNSSGGTDSVDLDITKFFAPKMFAANGRAVTKDDFYGLLFSSGLLPASITKSDQVNVWGGEEADPPSFGRVFVSYANPSLSIDNPFVGKSISFLKNKSIVSILPEYVEPQPITVNIFVSVLDATTGQTQTIKTLIQNYYNDYYKFNNSINLTTIKSIINKTYPTLSSVATTACSLSIQTKQTSTNKNLYFKNEFKTPGTSLGSVVTSTTFPYSIYDIQLVDKRITDTTGSLVAILKETGVNDGTEITSLGILGTVNYTTGSISAKEGVLDVPYPPIITVNLKNVNTINLKNEMLSTVSATVTNS